MPKVIDYLSFVGKTFGRLVILKDLGFVQYEKQKYRIVIARCSCGKEKEFRFCRLHDGSVTSCGCIHGISTHTLYNTHAAIKARCYNKKCPAYKNYGGRGIKMCEEWLNSVEAFYNWGIANGWEKGLEIDRINNDGNYEPENCRWATIETQCNNRRSNKFIEFNGLRLTLTQWSKKLGMNRHGIRGRLKSGWSIEKALTTPSQCKKD